MKLVEKKCPNCGAGLSFDENAKSCKCEYCKREFEVERKTDKDGASIKFDLNELKTPLKIFSYITIGHFLLVGLVVLLFIGLFIFGAHSIYKSISEQMKDIDTPEINNIDIPNINDEKNKLLSDINLLSNGDLSKINNDASIIIKYSANGVFNTKNNFIRDGDVERQKIYLAYKDDENIIISIYKAQYYNFFNQSERYTLFIPIVYRNVTNDIFKTLDDEKIEAPEFYFDSEHTTYFYGYSSLEEVINEKIEPLRNDYKITEK